MTDSHSEYRMTYGKFNGQKVVDLGDRQLEMIWSGLWDSNLSKPGREEAFRHVEKEREIRKSIKAESKPLTVSQDYPQIMED